MSLRPIIDRNIALLRSGSGYCLSRSINIRLLWSEKQIWFTRQYLHGWREPVNVAVPSDDWTVPLISSPRTVPSIVSSTAWP